MVYFSYRRGVGIAENKITLCYLKAKPPFIKFQHPGGALGVPCFDQLLIPKLLSTDPWAAQGCLFSGSQKLLLLIQSPFGTGGWL